MGLHLQYFNTKLGGMNESLLNIMKRRLNDHRGQWREVCELAGVGYDWMSRTMQGTIQDPGVLRVERVLSALDKIESKSRDQDRAA